MITTKIFRAVLVCLVVFFGIGLFQTAGANDVQHAECSSPVSTTTDECKHAEGTSFAWDPASDKEIESGGTACVSVLGGVTPYQWSVSGTGFSLSGVSPESRSNVLHANDTACGTATITVTDGFKHQVTGYVRSKNGQWVYVADGCIIPPGACPDIITSCMGDGRTYCCIYGKYYQVQRVSGHISPLLWGLCPGNCCDPNGAYSCVKGDCHELYGCETCVINGCCKNSGYAGSTCPPICRRWCRCNLDIYYMEWQCVP